MRELADKIIYLVCVALCIELVLFKFLPDIGTATVQGDSSTLVDFTAFRRSYLLPGSVHYARFLGNHVLYLVAKGVAPFVSSADIRLHPLRIAAGILTPLYAVLGAIPVLSNQSLFDWRAFFIPYALAVIMSLYVYYPCDMPALAILSIGLYLVLQQRLLQALAAMLVLGLFRESSFHLVWCVGAWALCSRSPSPLRRSSWFLAFAAAFAVEYCVVRMYFPGPLSSSGGIVLDPEQLFLGKGLLSLTTLCSLSLAAIFPIICWLKLQPLTGDDWRIRFFKANCAVFPLWIVFYRMLSGNISEFRMLLPAILPCVYGFAYASGTQFKRGRRGDAVRVRTPSGRSASHMRPACD